MIRWFEKDELNYLDEKGKELQLLEQCWQIIKYWFWTKQQVA
jgi:hypothetical protein